MGKIQMSNGEPIKLSTTFLVFFSNHLFLPECGWVSYCMKGKSMGKEIRIGQRPIFENRVLNSLARKNAQKRMPFCYAFTFFSFLTFWEQLKFFLCLSIHVFGCWLHFSQGLEVVFVMPGPGLSSSRFWNCWCIFPFTFFAVSMTIGLTHWLFGMFFPAVSRVHW